MLLNLSAKNFILIDKLDLDFASGLHVITGETGSGKSILLEALLFCLGYKFETDIIRSGTDCAIVSAEFLVPEELVALLEEHKIEHEGSIIIKRHQAPNNRKKLFINDQIVTQKLISQVAEHLVEVHSQNSHSNLLNPAMHLFILDSYSELEVQREEVASKFRAWQGQIRTLAELEANKDLIAREIDYLAFVVNEIESLNIKKGEEEALTDARIRLQREAKDRVIVNSLINSLEEPSIYNQILSAQKIIHRSIKDDSYLEVERSLDQMLIYLEEAKSCLSKKITTIEEYGDLDSIEERLFAIRALARKYNIAPDELLDYHKQSEAKLNELNSRAEQEQFTHLKLSKALEEYIIAAEDLSKKRELFASKLASSVSAKLEGLKLAGAEFKIEIERKDINNAAATGLDDVRFLAITNPGTPLAPIDKIASGGELSRFMLAIKAALLDKFTKPVVIFDEVDTGIGGMVADAVGARLKSLSKVCQVITITHQPQVAAKADHHLLVRKVQSKDSTISCANFLSEEERLEEIARMISGQEITDTARKVAKELQSG